MPREMNQVVYELTVEDRGGAAAADRVAGALDRASAAQREATAVGAAQTSGLRALDQATTQTVRSSASAANAWARWQATADPAVRAAQQLARAQADIDRAVRQGLTSQERAAAVMGQLQQRYAGMNAANENVARSSRGMGSAVQQAGFQVGDFATQIASGQDPMRAFIQQGTQLISMFGVWGAVVGAAGAVIGALVVSLDVFTSSAAEAAAAQERLQGAIDANNDVLEVHKRLGAELETQRQDEIASVGNLARYYNTLTEEKRRLAQVELEMRRIELMREQAATVEAVTGSGGSVEDFIAGSVTSLPGRGPRPGASVTMSATAEVQAALETTRDLMNEIATATDISADQAAEFAVRVNDLARPGGALEQAAAAGGPGEAARLTGLQERLGVTLQTMVDTAQMLAAAERELEANAQAMDVVTASPEEREQRLAELPALLESASNSAADLARELEQAQEQADRQNFSVEKYIVGLEDVVRVEQLSTEEKKVQEALLRAQALLVDNQGQALRELTQTERERIENAVRTGEALDRQRKAVEEMEKAVTDATDDVTDYAAETFADLFGDTELSWETMWDNLRQTAIQTLARIASEMLLRPLIQPIVAQMVGAAPSLFGLSGSTALSSGSAGGGGFSMPNIPGLGDLFGGNGGIGSFLSRPIFGTSGLPATTAAGHASLPFGAAPGAFTSGSFLPGFTFGNALSGIGIGAGIGGLLASLTGGNSMGGTLGGGLGGLAGAAIGSLVPGIGTLLGGAIGGGLFGFAGSLFGGGGPSVGPNSGANLGFSGGRVLVTTAGADNGGDVAGARSLAQGVANAVNALAAQLGATSVAAHGYQFGSFGGQLVGRQGGRIFTSGDAETIVRDTIMSMVRGGAFGGLDATTSTVLRNSQASTLQGLLDDVAFGKSLANLSFDQEKLTQAEQAVKALNDQIATLAQRARALGLSEAKLIEARDRAIRQLRDEFERGIEMQILAITDPMKAALESLSDAQKDRLRDAKALGADLVEVERLAALERAEVLKRQLGDLKAWLDGQAITSTAITGTGRLAEAQAQFSDVLAAIRGGSATGENVGRVTSLADTIIGLAAQLYGGTAQHAALEQMVRSQVASIGREMGLPGFAAGGSHLGGLRVVGELGPELEATGPARYWSAAQTTGMLGASREDSRNHARLMLDQTAEVRGLRAAVEELAVENKRLNAKLDRLLTDRAARRAA